MHEYREGGGTVREKKKGRGYTNFSDSDSRLKRTMDVCRLKKVIIIKPQTPADVGRLLRDPFSSIKQSPGHKPRVGSPPEAHRKTPWASFSGGTANDTFGKDTRHLYLRTQFSASLETAPC
ncbi:hypothetical protein CDAR_378941 [Caerostris darwini]|uniref:Uncharacterized protein n=1 Tax=Caerostris darwini TaxID=1538125 RepID=A0AAV4TZS8_9ARAC|nr:hypothetical protein CDAR_378941 [Caerostris darwini]